MKVYANDKWHYSRIAQFLFYKNYQLMQDEMDKNDRLYNNDTTKISEANVNFLKEHIKSKEHFYKLLEEYQKDDKSFCVLQERYEGTPSLYIGKEQEGLKGLKRILSDSHNIREKGLSHENSCFAEYAELINHKDGLFILEVGVGRGRGLYSVAKRLKQHSYFIGVDMLFYFVKTFDAVADNMGLSDRMCGYMANFWNLPFDNEAFDVVCSNHCLSLSYEANRTVQEISRVLKPNGRFVCLETPEGFFGRDRSFDYLDISDSEWRTIYRKAKLYTGFDDLVDLSKEYNLSLFQHKIFQHDFSSGNDVLSVFTKN